MKRWTKDEPYTIEIIHDLSRSNIYGPFSFEAVASYAAQVIHGNIEEGKQPSLAIYCGASMVIEVLGGNSIKPSPHYRARIADADIYDMAPPAHRAELDYILISCCNAGANGQPWSC